MFQYIDSIRYPNNKIKWATIFYVTNCYDRPYMTFKIKIYFFYANYHIRNRVERSFTSSNAEFFNIFFIYIIVYTYII